MRNYAFVSKTHESGLAILGAPEFGDAALPHGLGDGVTVATMSKEEHAAVLTLLRIGNGSIGWL